MEIQRYDMIAVTRCGEGWQELQREAEGEWMRHEDHLAALAAQQEEIDRLKADLASTEESLEAQRLKYDGCPHKPIERCGCSLDQIGDVCAHHAPALREALASIVELRAENAKLQARLDAMSAPVSDEEWCDITHAQTLYSGINHMLAARAKTEATG